MPGLLRMLAPALALVAGWLPALAPAQSPAPSLDGATISYAYIREIPEARPVMPCEVSGTLRFAQGQVFMSNATVRCDSAGLFYPASEDGGHVFRMNASLSFRETCRLEPAVRQVVCSNGRREPANQGLIGHEAATEGTRTARYDGRRLELREVSNTVAANTYSGQPQDRFRKALDQVLTLNIRGDTCRVAGFRSRAIYDGRTHRNEVFIRSARCTITR